jgi:uncharacterized membrane protein
MTDTPMQQRQTPTEERKETGRLEAFSDGVFAIAITLLVLNLAVPTISSLHGEPEKTLAQVVASEGSQFVAYGVSFLTILVMWMNHHSICQFVVRLDRPFIIINGLLLLFTTFVNYPTALVANFVNSTHVADGKFAAGFYSATFIVIAVLYNLLWHRAADGGRLIVGGVDQRTIDTISRQDLAGLVLYVAAFLLAFANAWASVLLNAALAIFFAFAGRVAPPERRLESEQVGEGAAASARTTERTTL